MCCVILKPCWNDSQDTIYIIIYTEQTAWFMWTGSRTAQSFVYLSMTDGLHVSPESTVRVKKDKIHLPVTHIFLCFKER